MAQLSLLTALTLRKVHAVSRLPVLLAALTGLQQLSLIEGAGRRHTDNERSIGAPLQHTLSALTNLHILQV